MSFDEHRPMYRNVIRRWKRDKPPAAPVERRITEPWFDGAKFAGNAGFDEAEFAGNARVRITSSSTSASVLASTAP